MLLRLTTDNGTQFTSSRFVETLNRLRITHRRTAYHHPEGNSYIERFHRSLKEEEVWTTEYRSLEEARASIAGWIEEYNHERPHRGVGNRTPHEAFLRRSGSRFLGQLQKTSAGERFLADTKARQLNDSTVYKYRLLFRRIGEFADNRGLRYLKELDLPTLDEFRTTWTDGPRSSLKKLERLRAFLRFCERRNWIENNPAIELKAPRAQNRPTMPYSQNEMVKILAAVQKYASRAGLRNAQRLKAFVLLLRYSGMRIGDTVKCGVGRITANKLFLYTQKTGVPVHCILPDLVVRELEAAPRSSDDYFFWTGKSKLHSAIGKWQRRLQSLFTLAEIEGGHAHRFRDTFAVELLLAGVPLERVSVLLGHNSVRITEPHYSPWVRSRQDQLEQDLKRMWEQDPVALMQTKGTPEVHAKNRRIN